MCFSDRPLFADYWERFKRSLRALRERRQRTVYRLTLVKRYNISDSADDATELENYARLVREGMPDLIEVKAVTFCGTSKGSDITIKDVPWHEEVLNFCTGRHTHIYIYISSTHVYIFIFHTHISTYLPRNVKKQNRGSSHSRTHTHNILSNVAPHFVFGCVCM